MHSTFPPKPTDDPCDVVVLAPDTVRVAPSDEALSDLLHQAARRRLDNQPSAASAFSAGPKAPPVDTSFRPASIKEAVGSGDRWPIARRAVRAFITLLLAACIGLTAVAWKSYGDVAKKQIAKLATQLVLMTSPVPEGPALDGQPGRPTVQADAANAATPQPPSPAPAAPEAIAPAAAPSDDSAHLLQSMERELASLGQEVEQLKASMEQLKARQRQTSRDVVKPSEQNVRTRISAPLAGSAAARARKPTPSFSPSQTVGARAFSQAGAPYSLPQQRQPEPQTSAEPPRAPELSSVPRPPLPVR